MSIADDSDGSQSPGESGDRLRAIMRMVGDAPERTVPTYAEPEYDQPPYRGAIQAYVIATTERSGSTLLCDLLRRCGRMGVPAEYFSTGPVTWPMAQRFGTINAKGRIDMLPFVRELLRARTTPNGRFGVNLHHWQTLGLLPRASTARLLLGSKYVWLKRRDLLAQAISLAIARKTNQWYRPREAPAADRIPPPDVEQVRREIAYLTYANEEWQQIFATNGIAPMEVFYEDLVADPDAVCGAICRLVEIRTPPRFDLAGSGYARQAGPANETWRAAYLQALAIPRPPDR